MKLKISGFAVGLLLSKCDSVTDLKAQGGKGCQGQAQDQVLEHLQEVRRQTGGSRITELRMWLILGSLSQPTLSLLSSISKKNAVTLILFAQVSAAPPRLSTSCKTQFRWMDKSHLQRPSQEHEPATVGASTPR